jgi:hypothetical protein
MNVMGHGSGPPRASDTLITDAIVAGWTGRDLAAVEHHVRELEKLGVRRPASTPEFYRVVGSPVRPDRSSEFPGEGRLNPT